MIQNIRQANLIMTISRVEEVLIGTIQRLIQNTSMLFWVLQLLGWGAYFIVSSLTLTLFYNEPSIEYIAHNLIRAILGAVFTWPLKVVCSMVWNQSLLKRLIYVLGSSVLLSIVWTITIIQIFEEMIGYVIPRADYGGWIYSAIFIFISWAAIYHGIKYYLLLQEQTRQLLQSRAASEHQLFKRSEAENQARMAKLKFLSYQLNPHFLFNTLNSIYSLIGSGNNTRARNMVSQLSQFLRAALAHGDDLLIPLEKEVATLERYLEIEKTRFGQRLVTKISCDNDSLMVHIPIFILQPLVENSIKHAISKSMEPGVIRVQSRLENDRLKLVVEDSGIGGDVSQSYDEQSIGVGLTNTRERLTVIYKNDFTLDMDNSDLGGIRITVELPISQKEIST